MTDCPECKDKLLEGVEDPDDGQLVMVCKRCNLAFKGAQSFAAFPYFLKLLYRFGK